jgi:hypothetical protein
MAAHQNAPFLSDTKTKHPNFSERFRVRVLYIYAYRDSRRGGRLANRGRLGVALVLLALVNGKMAEHL